MCSYLSFKQHCWIIFHVWEMVKLETGEWNKFFEVSKLGSSGGRFCPLAYWILKLMLSHYSKFFCPEFPFSYLNPFLFFHINIIQEKINCIHLKCTIWGVLTNIATRYRFLHLPQKGPHGPLPPFSTCQQETQIWFCHYILVLSYINGILQHILLCFCSYVAQV